MKQHEAVIKVMEENGGFATLGHLYQHVFNIKECNWKTKTPFASIRRIVQDSRFFFKINPGLWALKSYKNQIQQLLELDKKNKKKENNFTHTYYQGLIVEIGNIKNYQTFIPNQDKNRLFLNKSLKDFATIKEMYSFTYPKLVRRAKTVDVIWFNDRNMPSSMFEIEHTGEIQNSLVKYVELQDFNTNFYIIADKIKKHRFVDVISKTAFKDIKDRIQFRDYEYISKLHSKEHEFFEIKKNLDI